MTHRLRFAPSPTGYLHVGGARTALFNWLFVKKYGGQFLLRIEDTDKARSTDESTRAIFEGLEWLGLELGRGRRLSGREPRAPPRRRADRCSTQDTAYRCFCTQAELDEQRTAARGARRSVPVRSAAAPGSIPAEVERRASRRACRSSFAFACPSGETAWTDLVHGPITFPNKDIGEGDFIILRTDGTPIYNLAVVSDDIAMRITLVMRGDDHISNTPNRFCSTRRSGRRCRSSRTCR